MLKTLSEAFFSLVFPLGCELCGTLLPSGASKGICQNCQKGISLIVPPHCERCGRHVLNDKELCGHCVHENFHFDRAFACVYYDDKMKKLLHAFKFERRRYLLPFFASLMNDFAHQHLFRSHWDRVVPVPMDGTHERERGFNQAKLLSSALAKKSGWSYAPETLGCRKVGAPQSSLKKSERKRNVADRFFVQKKAGAFSGHVLLVDDILTTGQTASACAKALKNAGAQTVSVFALARGM